jgi:hypothetical protein
MCDLRAIAHACDVRVMCVSCACVCVPEVMRSPARPGKGSTSGVPGTRTMWRAFHRMSFSKSPSAVLMPHHDASARANTGHSTASSSSFWCTNESRQNARPSAFTSDLASSSTTGPGKGWCQSMAPPWMGGMVAGTFVENTGVEDLLERGPVGGVMRPALLNQLGQLRRTIMRNLCAQHDTYDPQPRTSALVQDYTQIEGAVLTTGRFFSSTT